MRRFLISRVEQAVAVLFGVTVIVFILIHLLPGGEARAILGPRAPETALRSFDVANGYNRPVFIQYFRWLGELFRGNLGYSYKYNQTVSSLLGTALPKSLLLVGLAMILALLVAVVIGVIQAVHRNRILDYVLTGITFVFYSMPVFWLGLILILYLAVYFHIFPAEAPQGATVGAVLQDPSGLVLPVLTLTLITMALFSRYVRSSMIDNLVQDYVRTARAKGVSKPRLLLGHVLRNALLPIATLIGTTLPIIIGGAVVTETLFNYPGMGLLFWNAAENHDYPVLLGFTLIVGVATVLGSLLADLLYAWLDPRVRY